MSEEDARRPVGSPKLI